MDKKYQRQSEKVIRGHLGKQSHSKETIEEYCRRRHITPSTFYNWKRRYGNRAKDTTVPQQQFSVPIPFRQIGIASLSGAPFRLHCFDMIIEIPQQFDRISLERLLSCLSTHKEGTKTRC